MPEYMLTSQSCSYLYSLNCFAKSNLHVEQPILITFLVVALLNNSQDERPRRNAEMVPVNIRHNGGMPLWQVAFLCGGILWFVIGS